VALPIIPIIAWGHLAKCVATSILHYYEKFFVQTLFSASGVLPDTVAYNKLLKGTHITASIQALNRQQLALRISLAKAWLLECGQCTLPGHAHTIASTAADLPLSPPSPVFSRVTLDSNCRPITLEYGSPSVQLSDAFMAWSEAKALNHNAADAVPEYNPPSDVAAQDGQLHAGVQDRHAKIFQLKMNNGGGDRGLRVRCKELEIATGLHPITALLREKLFAFYVAANGALDGEVRNAAAGAAAANEVTDVGAQRRLPELPQNLNTNHRVLHDFLFVEIPPWLLLVRLMRVRDHDDGVADVLPHGCAECGDSECCRCSSRHPWIVCSKAMLETVFWRRMPNYQVRTHV
jgi:hypothetical protein